jgi:hypothetical protein
VCTSKLNNFVQGSLTTVEAYLLRSTLLGGSVISEYKGDGIWSKSHVYAGAERLGRQTTAEVGTAQSIWETLDPITGEGVKRLANGLSAGGGTGFRWCRSRAGSGPFPVVGSGDEDGLFNAGAFKKTNCRTASH